MRRKLRYCFLLLVFLLLGSGQVLAAPQGTGKIKVGDIYYKIIKEPTGKAIGEVAVTCQSSRPEVNYSVFADKTLTIPSSIQYKGKTYKVAKLEYKALRTQHSPKKIVIPGTIDFKERVELPHKVEELVILKGMTHLPDYFLNSATSLKKVTLPEGLRSIGERAFYYSQLKTLELPSSLELIKVNAFLDSRLESIKIPAGVKKIEAGAFAGCRLLKDIEVDKSNKNYSAANGMLFTKSGKTLVAAPGLEGTVVVPPTVVIIGRKAFCSASGVWEVVLPDSVKSIKSQAFERMGIVKIHMPDGIKSIGSRAFAHAFLEEVVLPEELETIGSSAFYHVRLLDHITIPSKVRSVGKKAFAYSDLKEVEIKPGLEAISDSMFSHCEKLEKVIIPETVTLIGYDAFFENENLKEIELPAKLERIKFNAFFKALDSLTIPASVKHVEDGALSDIPRITFENPQPPNMTCDAIYKNHLITGYTPERGEGYLIQVPRGFREAHREILSKSSYYKESNLVEK